MPTLNTQNFRPNPRTFALLALLFISACSTATAIEPPPAVFPTASPSPEPSAIPPTPTESPFEPPITRLTDPGCCAQPFWSADSSLVLFLDKPEPTSPTAIYGAPVTGGAPTIVSERVGIPSPDGRYLTFLDDSGSTAIRDVASGSEWPVDSKGLRPFFSLTSQRLAWSETIEESSSDFSRRRNIISVSNIDGTDAREVITMYGGGIGGWLDDNRLLLVGRIQQEDPDLLVFAYNVQDNTLSNIVSENRVRNVAIAPGGEWLLYTVGLDPTNSANDGLWVVKTDGSQRFKVEVVGSARWRDATHLLIIPYDPDAPSHRLWQFDATTGKASPITNPDINPFRVAQADWSVSRDGKYAVFVNEQDQALWLITLPPTVMPPA